MSDGNTVTIHSKNMARHHPQEKGLHQFIDLFDHGSPESLRSDHGFEVTMKVDRRWLAQRGVQTLFLKSGSS